MLLRVTKQKVRVSVGFVGVNWYQLVCSPVAQLVERPAVNRFVAGSSPARGANISATFMNTSLREWRSTCRLLADVFFILSSPFQKNRFVTKIIFSHNKKNRFVTEKKPLCRYCNVTYSYYMMLVKHI